MQPSQGPQDSFIAFRTTTATLLPNYLNVTKNVLATIQSSLSTMLRHRPWNTYPAKEILERVTAVEQWIGENIHDSLVPEELRETIQTLKQELEKVVPPSPE